MIIIADIAGQYDALMRLVAKFPNEELVLVGDMVDRGPKSKEVIEWAMKTPRVTALLGNHEHMMLCEGLDLPRYDFGLWYFNGGTQTVHSYNHEIPKEHLDWMAKLPLCVFKDNCLITHTALPVGCEIDDLMDRDCKSAKFDLNLIWNRHSPERRPYYQIFGHNSHWGWKDFGDANGAFATCIDQSQKEVLTAIHWPSMEVTTEPYVKKETYPTSEPVKEVVLNKPEQSREN